MKKSVLAIVIAVVAILVTGAFFILNKDDTAQSDQTSTTTQNTPEQQTQTEQPSNEQNSETTITYSDSGFTPASITVKTGTTMTVTNNSSNVLQFDSNPHPDHTDNPELNVGIVSPGKSATFTVTTTGNWQYHNHLNDEFGGTIIVE